MRTKLFLIAIFSLLLNAAKAQCSASFTFSNTGNGNVSFTSTSTGTNQNTFFSWTFGDGNSFFSIGNQYASNNYQNGIYTAVLMISDSMLQCSSTATVTFTVNNAPCTGSVSFTYYAQQNGNVYFTNTSPGMQNFNWNWSFGDGGNSNLFSPMHTYTASGIYNVTFTATDQLAICSYSTVQSISVTVVPCNLNASFVYTINGGNVTFNSTSTGTNVNTNYNWNFGDGYYDWVPNTAHTYSAPGTYSVTLTLSDSLNFCNSNITQTIFVNAPCLASVNFNMYKDSTQNPAIVWDVYPNYPMNVAAANWNWGDGSNTNSLYPSHTYSAAGMYNICVTITVSCGATATACLNQNIYRNMQGAENMAAGALVNVLNPIPTKINQNNREEIVFSLFPNPNSGEFSILASGLSEKTRISIYSLLGEKVYDENIDSNSGSLEKKIKLGEINAGTYLMKLSSGNVQKNSRLVITH